MLRSVPGSTEAGIRSVRGGAQEEGPAECGRDSGVSLGHRFGRRVRSARVGAGLRASGESSLCPFVLTGREIHRGFPSASGRWGFLSSGLTGAESVWAPESSSSFKQWPWARILDIPPTGKRVFCGEGGAGLPRPRPPHASLLRPVPEEPPGPSAPVGTCGPHSGRGVPSQGPAGEGSTLPHPHAPRPGSTLTTRAEEAFPGLGGRARRGRGAEGASVEGDCCGGKEMGQLDRAAPRTVPCRPGPGGGARGALVRLTVGATTGAEPSGNRGLRRPGICLGRLSVGSKRSVTRARRPGGVWDMEGSGVCGNARPCSLSVTETCVKEHGLPVVREGSHGGDGTVMAEWGRVLPALSEGSVSHV